MLLLLQTGVMDEQYIHRVAKLIPFAVKNKSLPTMAFSYHFEPPVDDNGQLGSFFVVIEIMANQNLASQLIDLIIKTVGEVYYNEQYEAEPEERFEKALKEVNLQIKQLFGGKDKSWQTKISAIIGIINQNNLLLSQAGSATAFLYRKKRTTSLADESTSKKTPSDKTFAHITSGELKPLDRILFATPAIMFQFSLTELRNIITDNSPNAAVNKLSAALATQSNSERCAAVVIEVTTPEIAAETPLTHAPDEVMIGEPPTTINKTKEKALPVAKNAVSIAKQAAEKTSTYTKERFVPSAKEGMKKGWNSLWTEYINPNPKRALAIFAALLLVLIIASSFIFSINPNRDKIISLYSEAQTLKASGQTSLEKGDKSSATKSLQKSSDNIKQIEKLQPKSEDVDKLIQSSAAEQKTPLNELATQINQLLDQAQDITRISPKQIADLSTVRDARFTQLISIGGSEYTLNVSDGSLYKTEAESGDVIKVANDSSLKNVVSSTPGYAKDSIFFLTSDNKVLLFRLATSNLSTLKLTSGEWPAGSDIASYLSNLYILTPKDNQIYKFTQSGAKYAPSGPYAKDENPELSSSKSFTINGSVFVGTETTEVKFYEKGYKQSFEISGMPDITGGLAKIFWNDSKSQLLGLSGDRQKIIIIDVTNSPRFSKQIVPSGISSIESMSVANGDITILSGNKLYTLSQ